MNKHNHPLKSLFKPLSVVAGAFVFSTSFLLIFIPKQSRFSGYNKAHSKFLDWLDKNRRIYLK
jgi:hypothetical protein